MSQFIATYGPAAKGRVGVRMLGGADDPYSLSVLRAADAALTQLNYSHIYISVPNLSHDFTTIDSQYGTENNQFHAANFNAAGTPVSTPLGDVNSDETVNIIDALMIAQQYVGLNPANFNSSVADVDCSGNINIIDALKVAQYYVGLISVLSCSSV